MIAIEDEGWRDRVRENERTGRRHSVLSNGHSPSISAAEVSIWPRKELGGTEREARAIVPIHAIRASGIPGISIYRRS